MKSVRGIVFMFSAAAILLTTLVLSMTASNDTPNNCTRTKECVSTALTEASKSVVMIHLDKFHSGGTGTLIGRSRVDEDTWEYNVLTAYHVVESMLDALRALDATASKEEIDNIKSITIGNRNGFHSKIVLYSTKMNSSSWLIPTQDWAIFSIHLDVKLPCAELATRSEFNSITPFEKVYGIGADMLRGIFTRDGYISSTDCVEPFHTTADPSAPWLVKPDMFFRPFHTIHPGASGGPIFNKSGKIIGIYIAVSIERVSPFEVQQINELAIALKVFAVQEALADTHSRVTIVEDNYGPK
jgi:hypothetical protein